MSEAATAETLAANRFFAERLASIESMLYRLTASHGQVLVDQNAESVLQKSHDHTPALSARSHPSSAHVGSPSLSDVGSPPLSARSHQSNFAVMPHGVHQSAQEFSKPKPNRGNTANAAAHAAAKYLKGASASNAVTADSEAAPVTLFSLLPGARNSAPLVVDSQPVDDVASKHSANTPVNRDSLEKAMQAMSGLLSRPPLLPYLISNLSTGLRTAPDLSGTTAAAVGALLKKNSGNPLHAETFDPLVIGATLEVSA
jgi:hypothetical protein